ncbi:MAG: SHOCT domain-containing protein [Pseudoxanthomonas sp.]|nr:SHOCT domain-containing protein [Pseudoxanthomonas sp.]
MRRTRSLIGTAARTAVITGTAKAVLGKGGSAAPPPEAPAAPAAPAAAAPTGMTDEKIAMLQKLNELKQGGILTEVEFELQKAKILAS